MKINKYEGLSGYLRATYKDLLMTKSGLVKSQWYQPKQPSIDWEEINRLKIMVAKASNSLKQVVYSK